ncbi:hypothetical protein [Streptomyces sp. ID05-47C]|uniref:DUF3885 domain-containing protein n=1 Tax=Streptomyces sp. ID05-47C TaxID=3028665 RepID=UPI0029A02A9E|nr:hypothetical protein [Streptomyces sp. ID05-47C]MDX3571285.1 hypothetical protein [Streptomyces sp. ID05-47C]
MSEALARLWRERHPSVPPLTHTFRGVFADRWVRFHSLPESKRYAESEDEYAMLLRRYNTVLDELFAGQEVFVVTGDWSSTADGPAGFPTPRQDLHPDGVLWWTEPDVSDPDPEFHTYFRFYADRRPWRPGCVDELLRAAADEEIVGVFLTDTGLNRIHAPYDGGADVVLTTPAERDRLRARHPGWLSPHPSGC